MRIRLPVFALVFSLGGASSGAIADEKTHRAAAEELLKVANTEEILAKTIDQMLVVQVKADPRLEPVKDVLKKFFNKHLGYSALKDEFIKMYTEEFTEVELREITAFYRTPTGQKTIQRMPSLMQKGAQLGMKRVQDNSAELQRMIEEALKKQ